MFKHRQWLCAFIGLFVSLGTARADWPEKQITMVACFAAGGGTDIAARIINTQLGEALGKPVVVENRGGAGGNIAIKAVQALPADGYTILVCSSAYVVNPSLFAQANYDPYKDFIPLMVMGASPNVFVVPAQSPVKSMQEFIEKAKAAPGTTVEYIGGLFKGTLSILDLPKRADFEKQLEKYTATAYRSTWCFRSGCRICPMSSCWTNTAITTAATAFRRPSCCLGPPKACKLSAGTAGG